MKIKFKSGQLPQATFTAARPVALHAALRNQEVTNGFTADYIAKADAARLREHLVTIRNGRISVGPITSAFHAVGQVLSGSDKRPVDILYSLRDVTGSFAPYPTTDFAPKYSDSYHKANFFTDSGNNVPSRIFSVSDFYDEEAKFQAMRGMAVGKMQKALTDRWGGAPMILASRGSRNNTEGGPFGDFLANLANVDAARSDAIANGRTVISGCTHVSYYGVFQNAGTQNRGQAGGGIMLVWMVVVDIPGVESIDMMASFDKTIRLASPASLAGARAIRSNDTSLGSDFVGLMMTGAQWKRHSSAQFEDLLAKNGTPTVPASQLQSTVPARATDGQFLVGWLVPGFEWVLRTDFGAYTYDESTDVYTVDGPIRLLIDGATLGAVASLEPVKLAQLQNMLILYEIYSDTRTFETAPLSKTKEWLKLGSSERTDMENEVFFPADPDQGVADIKLGQASSSASGKRYRSTVFMKVAAEAYDAPTTSITIAGGGYVVNGGTDIEWLGDYILDRQVVLSTDGTMTTASVAEAIAGGSVTKTPLTEADMREKVDEFVFKKLEFTKEQLGENSFLWIGIGQFGASRETMMDIARAPISQYLLQSDWQKKLNL